LTDLPGLVAEVVDAWSLDLGEPFPGGCASLVCPARRPDGTDAVLKVQYPHLDCRDEALALRQWDGDGAVRLLDHDPMRHALLLERCKPGGPLADLGHEPALDVLIGLLPRLWVPVADDAPYIRLADMARSWVAHLADLWEAAGRPFERRLIDAACSLVDDLAGTQGEAVLVNQDLHGENVLAAERKPWLVIDPKPLAGEQAFGLSPIVRSSELGHSSGDVHRRLDRLSAELGINRERARGWTIAQAVAWSIDGGEVFQRLWANAGLALAAMERADQALDAFAHVRPPVADDPRFLYARGRARLTLGDRSGGQADLHAVIGWRPEGDLLRQWAEAQLEGREPAPPDDRDRPNYARRTKAPPAPIAGV